MMPTAFTLGPFQTNCYVVEHAGDCWFIDASFGPGAMIAHARSRGLTPRALIFTHAHADHIAGAGEIVRAFPGLEVMIHGAEAGWLTDAGENLSAGMGMPITAPPATRLLEDGEVLTLAGQAWRVIHTPGHSPGGITLFQAEEGVALVGDALFAGSIGRTDFPGSDFATLERSIRTRLYALPEATRVLAGHGPATTIGRERLSNPFVRG